MTGLLDDPELGDEDPLNRNFECEASVNGETWNKISSIFELQGFLEVLLDRHNVTIRKVKK